MGTTSTSTISSKGQTVIPVEIRQRHALTEQSRLAWIDDGSSIRVVPVPAITRHFALLRAHGLLRKLPRTHRYQLTAKGRRIIAALLAACYADVEQLTKIAA